MSITFRAGNDIPQNSITTPIQACCCPVEAIYFTFRQVDQSDVGAETAGAQTDQVGTAIGCADFEGVVTLFADLDARPARRRWMVSMRSHWYIGSYRPIMRFRPLLLLLLRLPIRPQLCRIVAVDQLLLVMVVSVEPSPFDSGCSHHSRASYCLDNNKSSINTWYTRNVFCLRFVTGQSSKHRQGGKGKDWQSQPTHNTRNHSTLWRRTPYLDSKEEKKT